jgi:hypothetical protein
MALNPSGVMSIGGTTVGASINLELNLSATANSSIGQADFRALAQKPSGVISLSDFYGKSNIIVIPPITTNTADKVITAFGIPGYVAGESKLELTINSGVYLYATNVTTFGLKLIDFSPGDTINIINNGYILGKGGKGGYGQGLREPSTLAGAGQAGGAAISISCNVTITNNSYIAGGGGGGGGANTLNWSPEGLSGGGGGGAGGGEGGDNNTGGGKGGLGGGPGQAGQQGGLDPIISEFPCGGGGGGGGRIVPGVGGIAAGGPGPNYSAAIRAGGGGAGGGAATGVNLDNSQLTLGGSGGSAGNVGGSTFSTDPIRQLIGGGGGGGWGAAGGLGGEGGTGGVGGKAIALNGRTATITGSGIIYGAIS